MSVTSPLEPTSRLLTPKLLLKTPNLRFFLWRLQNPPEGLPSRCLSSFSALPPFQTPTRVLRFTTLRVATPSLDPEITAVSRFSTQDNPPPT